MKTAEERAKELLYAIKHADTENECLSRIIESLKEQDKITRHACADSVLALQFELSNFKAVVDMDDAHQAIMNTKAV
jgi:hypothetical protein